MKVDFQAGADDQGRRLESVLRRLLPHQTLGALQKALRQGDIRLNGAKAAGDARVQQGDTLSVWDVLVSAKTQEKASPLPADWVVYEGKDLVVVNKPSGVLVHPGNGHPGNGHPGNGHPGAGHREGDRGATLDQMVRAWLEPSAAPSLSFRPGPLHRLDRETSGLVVFSRTLEGAKAFSLALAEHRVEKVYLAVLSGSFEGEREVTQPLSREETSRTTVVSDQGDRADTRFEALSQSGDLTLVRVSLGTGRTHQIRAHAQAMGHPLAGDKKYGGGPTPTGLDVPWLLHAWRIQSSLVPPLEAPLPSNRLRWLEKTFKFDLERADAVH